MCRKDLLPDQRSPLCSRWFCGLSDYKDVSSETRSLVPVRRGLESITELNVEPKRVKTVVFVGSLFL